MSYARFGRDSDVYVFLHVNGFFECCGCVFGGEAGRYLTSTADVIKHLEQHKAKGHKVPDDAILDLQKEAEENDAWIRDKAAQGRR